MTSDRRYPEAPVSGFPTPPQSIELADGRTVTFEEMDPADSSRFDALLDMYDDFDPADRAQGIPPVGRARIRQWLETVLDHGVDVIASVNGEIIGHATLVPGGDESYELAIFVHQDHRRQGVGSSLLEVLLGAAAEMGVEFVWLSVERWNTGAIKLYESVGFEACDSGSFELEMSLRLVDQTARTG